MIKKKIQKIFIRLDDRKNNDQRLKYFSEIERESTLPKKELLERQWGRFLSILDFAYNNIPFYKDSFVANGITPDCILSPSDLVRIPVLTRQDIRQNQEQLLNPLEDRRSLVETATGGTTDSPIKLYLNKDCLARRRAATSFFYKWFGYELGDSMAFLWGAEQDYPKEQSLKNKIGSWFRGKGLYLPTSYLNDEIMWSYYDKLRTFRPKVLQAYPTPLYIFACFLEQNDLKLSIPSINVAAEHLYEYQRERIESVFCTKIFNWYGARELGHIATECCVHKGMHINAPGLFVEVIKEGKQVQDKPGELVITDLLNRAMPLIRYKIGDVGSVSYRSCPCGSSLPLIEEVGGRYADTFKKRDGTFIPGVAFTNRVIKEHLGIKKLQIIQKDFEHLQLNIVKGENYEAEALTKLEEQLCEFMHERLNFDVHFVDDILPEKSGKILFCKSEVALPSSKGESRRTVA